MNGRALFWGFLFILLGVLFATGLVPAADGWGTGPRVGLSAGLIMLGLTLALAANAEWFLRKTTRPEDYKGTCPVGSSCGQCGAFNYKPRTTCRSCSADLAAVGSETFGEPEEPRETEAL
ncbi:MAG: hypothetical protein ACPGQL_10755 [Thermoplasmatota archaeon]